MDFKLDQIKQYVIFDIGLLGYFTANSNVNPW